MIEAKLIARLRCPVSGGELKLAEKSLVERINAAIQEGTLRDRVDQKITQTIDGGLLTSEAVALYPIRGGIPTMIADESIALAQLDEC